MDHPRQSSRRVGERRRDPVSGMAPELEEARALGELREAGLARRSGRIVYAAWDGEEPALLGSTEWVEQHDAELREKAVVYINSDGNGRGFLQASGSHTLEHFVNEVAQERRGSGNEGHRLEAAGRRAQICTGSGRPARAKRGRAPTCASARSARGPTTRRSSSTTASRR